MFIPIKVYKIDSNFNSKVNFRAECFISKVTALGETEEEAINFLGEKLSAYLNNDWLSKETYKDIKLIEIRWKENDNNKDEGS